MGYEHAQAARDLDLPSMEKLVLICLAFRVDNTTLEAWPSLDRLCQDTGIKKRHTVIKYLDSLEGRGLISRQDRWLRTRSGKIERTSNMYRLDYQKMISDVTKSGPSQGHPPAVDNSTESEGVVPDRDRGSPSEGQGWSPTGTGVVPDRDSNRSVNQSENPSMNKSSPPHLSNARARARETVPSPQAQEQAAAEAQRKYMKRCLTEIQKFARENLEHTAENYAALSDTLDNQKILEAFNTGILIPHEAASTTSAALRYYEKTEQLSNRNAA